MNFNYLKSLYLKYNIQFKNIDFFTIFSLLINLSKYNIVILHYNCRLILITHITYLI